MSEINVLSRMQTIIVEPESRSVSVVYSGERGLIGPVGPQGPQGIPGPPGTMMLVGAPIPWLTANIPVGYIEFAGQAIVQATYPQLFAIFGGTLPDLRGRTLLGANATYSVGSTGGTATETLSTAQMPAHTHPVCAPGNHSWGVSYGSVSGAFTFIFQPYQTNGPTYAGSPLTAETMGGGQPHNNLPPYVAVRWITVAA